MPTVGRFLTFLTLQLSFQPGFFRTVIEPFRQKNFSLSNKYHFFHHAIGFKPHQISAACIPTISAEQPWRW
jgi:hypothetical protein